MITVKIVRREDGKEWLNMGDLREPLIWALEKYHSELSIPEKENSFYGGVYKYMKEKLNFPDDLHYVTLNIQFGTADKHGEPVYFFHYTNVEDDEDYWWIDPQLFEIKESIQ